MLYRRFEVSRERQRYALIPRIPAPKKLMTSATCSSSPSSSLAPPASCASSRPSSHTALSPLSLLVLTVSLRFDSMDPYCISQCVCLPSFQSPSGGSFEIGGKPLGRPQENTHLSLLFFLRFHVSLLRFHHLLRFIPFHAFGI